jgi:hypothetical protein
MTDENPSLLLEKQLCENLPDVIRRVVEDYSVFAIQDSPLEAKDFERHHKAARSGVAHLLAIQKLAEKIKNKNTEAMDELDGILREAQQILNANHDERDNVNDDEAEDQL